MKISLRTVLVCCVAMASWACEAVDFEETDEASGTLKRPAGSVGDARPRECTAGDAASTTVFQDPNGKWRYQLVRNAGDAVVVRSVQTLDTAEEAESMAARLLREGYDASLYELTEERGLHFLTITAEDGTVLGISGKFRDKLAREDVTLDLVRAIKCSPRGG